MTNEFRNVIVLGELDYFLVSRFEKDNDRAYRCFEYTPKHLPVQQNEDGATTINALYIINNTLEKIAEGLNVPLWSLFVSEDKIVLDEKTNEFVSFFRYKGIHYTSDTLEEFFKQVDELKIIAK